MSNLDEIPTTLKTVLQNPTRRVLCLRVHERYELPMSESSRRPMSSSLWTESYRSPDCPTDVLARFLLLAMYVGLLPRMNSSDRR